MDSTAKRHTRINNFLKSLFIYFFHLRQPSKLKHVLQSVIHASIASHLDYSNSVPLWCELLFSPIRIKCSCWFHDRHHPPVLAKLHWLPVCFRIDFKIGSLFLSLLMAWYPRTLQNRYALISPISALDQRTTTSCPESPL